MRAWCIPPHKIEVLVGMSRCVDYGLAFYVWHLRSGVLVIPRITSLSSTQLFWLPTIGATSLPRLAILPPP
jgi:hypothetical protein